MILISCLLCCYVFLERDCLSKICVIDVLRFMILSFKLVQEPEEPNDDEEPASLAELSSVPWTIPDAGFKQEQLLHSLSNISQYYILYTIIYSTHSLYIYYSCMFIMSTRDLVLFLVHSVRRHSDLRNWHLLFAEPCYENGLTFVSTIIRTLFEVEDGSNSKQGIIKSSISLPKTSVYMSWLESFVTWRPWSHRLGNCCFWQDKSLNNNAVGFVGLLNGRACCFCAIVTESANWIAKSVQSGAVRRKRLKVIAAILWYIVYRCISMNQCSSCLQQLLVMMRPKGPSAFFSTADCSCATWLHVFWEALKGMPTMLNGRRRFITVCFFFWFFCRCFCFLAVFLDDFGLDTLLSALFSCGWDDYRRQIDDIYCMNWPSKLQVPAACCQIGYPITWLPISGKRRMRRLFREHRTVVLPDFQGMGNFPCNWKIKRQDSSRIIKTQYGNNVKLAPDWGS